MSIRHAIHAKWKLLMKFAGNSARRDAARTPLQVIDKTLKYSTAHEPLLRRLASALVLHWDAIPDDVQDILIDQAVLVDDAAELKPDSGDFENFLRTAKTAALRPPVAAPAEASQ